MPFSIGMIQLREISTQESLKALLDDEEMRTLIGRPGGLLDIVDRVLPDLDKTERSWLGAIPAHQLEALRAVIESVAGNDELHLEIQFEPAYDFALKIYDYDKHVVARVYGPFPGHSFPREHFKSG